VATVRRFNAILSAKGYVWFWAKIAAALRSKYHWLIINCDSCGTVIDLDLSVKPGDPEASVRIAAAMGMAAHASLCWRGTHQFDRRIRVHLMYPSVARVRNGHSTCLCE